MDHLTVIGLMAGTCTTISFIPQIRLVFRTRKTRDLSLGAYLLLSCGLLLWVVYGIIDHAPAIVLPNTIVFLMSLYIILMKLRCG